MGGTNHIGSTPMPKLKIKHDFVVKVLNLDLPTYLSRLDLWLSGLGLTLVPHGLYCKWPIPKVGKVL